MLDTPSLKGRPYQRVAGDLRSKIHSGLWSAGNMLPGRKALAETYGVTTNTIDSAVALLVAEGLLRVEDRRGTFVAQLTTGDTLSVPAPATPESSAPPRPRRRREQTTIGIVAAIYPPTIEYYASQWQLLVLTGCEQVFGNEDGITLQFSNRFQSSPTLSTLAAVERITDAELDALILIFPEQASLQALPSLVERLQVPVVIVANEYLTLPTPHIYYDNTYDGYQAARHLLQRGYRRFILVRPYTANWAREREAGMRLALKHAGVPETALRVVPEQTYDIPDAVNHKYAGYLEAQRLFAEFSPSWGMLAANDYVACGVLQAAEEYGYLAGRDFGLVGFDDVPQAREVGLTSLRPPMEAIGQEAARMIIQALAGQPPAVRVCLRSHLIPRATTAGLAACNMVSL